MSRLEDLVLAADADIDAIASWLDGLDAASRVEQSRSLGPKVQRRLWRMARGRVVHLEHFVPADAEPLQPVRHYGRNTLPAFKLFEKRFCRPSEAWTARNPDARVLWGYNEGPTRKLVGPGYFVVRETHADSRGETVIDYYDVPPEKPEEWPPIRPNDRGPARVAYGFMHDFMRRVSEHVTIGRAYKHDRETPNCFTLCRGE